MAGKTAKAHILLVDDDEDLCKLLSLRLKGAGFEVRTCSNGKEALSTIPGFLPQVVVTDLRMEGMDGLALFDAINQQNPSLPVIMLTAHGTIPDAVEATHRGLFGYLTKPFDSEKLLETINRALSISAATDTNEADAQDLEWRREIISRSRQMEALLTQARRIAVSEVSILIQSESGTGKELLARAIHRASPRRNGPFVAVNCSAIPEQLLESELFGHVKGAFTGASGNRKGLFQQAEGGTIFLDEIGDMPAAFQSKLLRTLQESEVRPVGSDTSSPIDVRVISATHHDLEKATEKRAFREDLFYRLNVVMLELPPLRERREDIPLLANHFLARCAEKNNEVPKKYSPDAMELLIGAPWPGNIRQLFNVIEQNFILSSGSIIAASLVNKALRGDSEALITLAEARDRFERDYLTKLLQMTEGNVTKAARLAGRNRTELYKLFDRHDLDPELFRQPT